MFPHSPFVQERRPFLRIHVTCFTIGLLLQNSVVAQVDPPAQDPQPPLEDVGNRQLGTLLNQHLQNQDLFSAAPVLAEFRKRMAAGELPGKNLDKISYYIGLGYMQGYSTTNEKSWLKDAAKEFQHYMVHFPHGADIHYVLANKVDCHRGNQEFAQAIPLLEVMLDRGRPYLAKFPSAMRLQLLEKLVQACTVTQDWDKAVLWAKKYLLLAETPGKRTMAAASLVEAYVAKGQYGEIDRLLPYMDSNNRYRIDPRLNFQFLQTGDYLAQEKKHAKASLFYSLTMTPKDIAAAYHELLVVLSTQIRPLGAKKRKYGPNFPKDEEKLLADLQF